MERGKLEYLVTIEKLEPKRSREKPEENVPDSLAPWHGRRSASQIIVMSYELSGMVSMQSDHSHICSSSLSKSHLRVCADCPSGSPSGSLVVCSPPPSPQCARSSFTVLHSIFYHSVDMGVISPRLLLLPYGLFFESREHVRSVPFEAFLDYK
ncbi:hypothetical protein BsWGS_15934 [Bradybaena similaris]